MISQKQIENSVESFRIGNKMKELREKNVYTLQDVVAKTDLSKEFLTQIENNEIVPPIAALLKLAKALNVDMSYFFQEKSGREKIAVTRVRERTRVERRPHHQKGEVNYIYEALETKKTDKHMQPFWVKFPPQDTSDMIFVSHEGEEFLHLLTGKLEFRSVDRVEILEPGDSIYFESDVNHSFRCLSEKPARAIAVVWSKP